MLQNSSCFLLSAKAPAQTLSCAPAAVFSWSADQFAASVPAHGQAPDCRSAPGSPPVKTATCGTKGSAVAVRVAPLHKHDIRTRFYATAQAARSGHNSAGFAR